METTKPPELHPTAGAPATDYTDLTPITQSRLSRREFMAASAVGLVALQQRHPVTLGVQSYSFRDRPLEAAIAAMQKLGLRSCELWQEHVEPAKMSREQLRTWRETVDLSHFHRIRERFARASIALSAYNLSFTDRFSDAEIERGFAMAAALGAAVITSSSNVKTVSRVAAAAARHKMPVGMHNHSDIKPNEFATRQSLEDALRVSPFIDVNLDIGHFTAANENAVTFLQQHHARIVTLHIKDRKRDQGPYTPFGQGDAPITKVLQLLQQSGWPIPANIEYEYEGGDSVDEVGKCLDYCRRALGI